MMIILRPISVQRELLEQTQGLHRARNSRTNRAIEESLGRVGSRAEREFRSVHQKHDHQLGQDRKGERNAHRRAQNEHTKSKNQLRLEIEQTQSQPEHGTAARIGQHLHTKSKRTQQAQLFDKRNDKRAQVRPESRPARSVPGRQSKTRQ